MKYNVIFFLDSQEEKIIDTIITIMALITGVLTTITASTQAVNNTITVTTTTTIDVVITIALRRTISSRARQTT
jgi:hypothetical protein